MDSAHGSLYLVRRILWPRVTFIIISNLNRNAVWSVSFSTIVAFVLALFAWFRSRSRGSACLHCVVRTRFILPRRCCTTRHDGWSERVKQTRLKIYGTKPQLQHNAISFYRVFIGSKKTDFYSEYLYLLAFIDAEPSICRIVQWADIQAEICDQ